MASTAREARRTPAPEPPKPEPAQPPPSRSGGLPASVASPISSSLGVDVSPVRVHSDANAATAAGMFGARALTIGSHVFLGAGERATDLPLMAHEVAHVVQQQGAPRVQLWARGTSDPYEQEAHRAAAAVVAQRPYTVRERTPPRIQRLGISDVLDWFADKANHIPGFRMFTIIIGVNPINGAKVERSGANILRAAVEFIPGGHLIVEALEKYGVFEKGGAWLEKQVATLGMTGRMFIDALKQFIDSLGWTDIARPWRVWDRAKEIFTRPIRRLIDFFVGLVTGILKLIKDAILKPLAKLAEGTPAWDLLLQVLGSNPITGETVPQSADKLIGGFMKLIGQEEVWNNIKRANAISRALQWFKRALSGLLAFVTQIPRMFLDALRSLEIADIILLPRAFVKVGRAFVGIAGRFFSWALDQVLSLLQIIFEVVAPGAVPYVRKAAGAFKDILRNPVRFIGTLVRAGKQGFDNFRKNFLNHLRKSLIDWLTGTLGGAGVYIPLAFELKEILKFVLSVLGLTWQNVRGKLLRLIPEPALRAIEAGLDIVTTLVKEGPVAAWAKIQESLSNLKEMVMEQVMSFVKGTIVEQAITKLLSMLTPFGAFIQAIIGIYNTIMFFVERLRQIAQVVAGFIDSIAAIAAGNIGAAAARVETTMAAFMTTVISFLARFAGLGDVATMVKKVVDRIRGPIDKALDRVVDWIISIGKRIFAALTKPSEPEGQASKEIKQAVKVELAGKSISDPQDASRLLAGIYGKFRAKGLKGLRLAYDPKVGTDVVIKASASVVDDVGKLPVLKKSIPAALSYVAQFHYLRGTTVLHVFYDVDNKSYPDVIENDPNVEHAEQVFKRLHLGALINRIDADRKGGRLKTPAKDPVRVLLQLNRIPCPTCSSIISTLTATHPNLRFVVQASSASNTASSEITIDYIETLLAAGVEVSTLKIYEAIRNKIVQLLKAAQAGQIKRLTDNQFYDLQAALPKIDQNLSEEKRLAALIEEAKKRHAAKTALAKVPPVGSGV